MQLKIMGKKGQGVNLQTLLPTVVIFAVVILATSLIAGIIQDVRQTQIDSSTCSGGADAGNCSAARNITNRGLTGMLNLSGQFGNIGTVIAIVVIIGLLVGAFLVFRGG